jgi:putative Ig domain-containing protein
VLAIRKTLETRSALAVFCLSVSALLSGCGGMGDDNSPTGASTSAAPGASTGTSVPTIQLSGTPPGTVVAGNAYVFQPTVQTTGGTATLSATGLPSWATINSSTGEISGTPTGGDVGTTSNIAIVAVDGSATASLPAFTIDVTAPAAGSASLSWTAPTQNTDGTPVTDLAGYHIYFGTSVAALNSLIDVPGAATTEYEISNLSSGTYYFIVVAYNSLGFESPASNQASKTI